MGFEGFTALWLEVALPMLVNEAPGFMVVVEPEKEFTAVEEVVSIDGFVLW